MTIRKYGKISRVEDGSPAYDAGILPGDELIAINSKQITDILEYSYQSMDESIDVEIRRDNTIYKFSINKNEEDDLGIEFEEELFDGLRSCGNNCVFCFLKQMPKGLRKSLYVRDDDYRLSFAQGNYITLTNLSDDDMDRIISQRMGPLYISVQATEPDVRTRLLGNPRASKVMGQLKAFADAHISMHTQIVLCPGINDRYHLYRSVHDLASLSPWVESIAVVPVGLTKYRDDLETLLAVDHEQALDIVNSCIKWQKEFKREYGKRLVYPSDEFYLLAGMNFPSTSAYEGFPQFENGVGISRIFLDELKKVQKRLANVHLRSGRYVLITGVLASSMVTHLSDILNKVDGISSRVCITKNKFFGNSVTVSGLLTGQDILNELGNTDEDEEILIPDVALNGDKFLDDITIPELGNLSRRRVTAVSVSPVDLIEYLKV